MEELQRVAVVLWSKNWVMQRPESVKTRFPTVAAVELEQGSSSARKKMKEREVAESPSGRPIYKASS